MVNGAFRFATRVAPRYGAAQSYHFASQKSVYWKNRGTVTRAGTAPTALVLAKASMKNTFFNGTNDLVITIGFCDAEERYPTELSVECQGGG